MSRSGSNKKLKSYAGSSIALNSNDHEEETDSPPLSKGSQRRQSQASLLEMNKKKDKEFVDKMLAKCFIVNNIDFNVVQTSAFGEFVKAMAEYGAAYKLPSYSTLRAKLILESRKCVDEYVSMVKLSWDTSASGYTIMPDIWTDIGHRFFINLVAYSPGEHVVQFITDNGSNFTSAGDILIGLYPQMYKTRCATHGIQLLLKDINEEVNWVKVATDEARIIIIVTPTLRRREVIKTIEPLVRVLRLVDCEGSTAGYLYEVLMRAKVAIKERCNSKASKKDREMKDGINFIHENLLLIEEKHPCMREVQLYRSRPATLFTAIAKMMSQTSHPGIWWDYNGDDLPVLKKYAIRILSQPCSASSCERNWSAFEAAQIRKRNRLSHEMLDTLVYVRMNMMMMDKFTSTMSRDLEPIDLEKLGELPDYEYEEIHMDEDANSTPTVEGYMDDLIDNDDISWLKNALF
ncbi:uncharacterized protein LOC116134606 [Pistacia vera]|uniref:uncharacterized protein LOC116134606 n=1 Tax=Pistacia vera TaxID=55513 RepID=UPI00126359F2|nr:uncharacterized protein LOC116134606 [Pistacia vera]